MTASHARSDVETSRRSRIRPAWRSSNHDGRLLALLDGKRTRCRDPGAPKKLYYHLGLLEQRGLLEVRSPQVIHGIIEKHYGAGQRASLSSAAPTGPRWPTRHRTPPKRWAEW